MDSQVDQNDPETPLEDLEPVVLNEVSDPEQTVEPPAEWGTQGVGFDAEGNEPVGAGDGD